MTLQPLQSRSCSAATLLAGAPPSPRTDADHRELAQRRPRRSGRRRSSPPSRPRTRASSSTFSPHGADRIQRRAERQARRRLRGRPDHLPPVRRRARALREGPARRPHRPRRRWRTSPTSRSPAGRPTTARTFCVPMASVHPRLHLQQGRLRGARPRGAEDRGRVLRRARQDQGGRHLHPDGDGHQRPVGSRDHGLPEHRPELLEGRGGPPGADRRRPEADRPGWVAPFTQLAKWKDYLGDGFEAQTYPDSQNLFTLGRAAIYPAGSWEIAPFKRRSRAPSRWAPSRRRSRRGRHLLHLRPCRHRASG